MDKRKNVLKEPLQCEQEFSVFLKRVREETGVLGEELAEGLMDASQLSRIESGQRPVGKTMRNRLLERLGITPDMYENLLNIEDYATWEQQQKILCAIDQKEFQTAEKRMKDYENCDPAEDKIKRQFCLVMKAEILKQQGADRVELEILYEAAVRLTVPNVEQVYHTRRADGKEKLLAVAEVNAVLEYEFHRQHPAGDFAAKCRFWMDYVENAFYDELSKAKIYPKIAYYYLREVLNRDSGRTPADLRKALGVCDHAIEMLRDMGRAYYLVELLEHKREILEHMIKNLTDRGQEQEAAAYKDSLQESAELEDLLKKLYSDYGVPVYMQSCADLYRQRWVFQVGDVLRIRRNMLKLTQEEVCEGICSVKTLRRAEKKQVNMQRETLGQILRRLGLSKEIQKTALVTNDREVLRLSTKLAFCINNREVRKARELLIQLKDRICLEIPENLQYILQFEALLDRTEGKISEMEFVSREEAALRCTLDIKEELSADKEIYLTEMEMTCIRQRICYLEDAEKRKQIDFLLQFFEKCGREYLLGDYIAMYEFVMPYITSELGNMGEYQFATELDKKAVKEVLKCRRLYSVNDFVYDILWNEKEQQANQDQQMEKEKMTGSLRQCLVLSHFCKEMFYEQIYLDKIHQVTQEPFGGMSLQGETISTLG